MGWTMRALVWRFTKLFEKRGDHHHRSGEEEPLVERRKEGLALSIKEESESFVTFYQERKWKFCHDNCLSCWVLIVSAWHGLVAKVLAINVQNLVSLLKQLRPGVIIITIIKHLSERDFIVIHCQIPGLDYIFLSSFLRFLLLSLHYTLEYEDFDGNYLLLMKIFDQICIRAIIRNFGGICP